MKSMLIILFLFMMCRGIWKQDIRYATNIQQQNLDKILKLLEQKLLIKTVRSIGSKTKKLYMLYDVTPAKEITGIRVMQL